MANRTTLLAHLPSSSSLFAHLPPTFMQNIRRRLTVVFRSGDSLDISNPQTSNNNNKVQQQPHEPELPDSLEELYPMREFIRSQIQDIEKGDTHSHACSHLSIRHIHHVHAHLTSTRKSPARFSLRCHSDTRLLTHICMHRSVEISHTHTHMHTCTV